MREMVQPMTNALPHLQPPKRLRGKAAEDGVLRSALWTGTAIENEVLDSDG